jgi:hypothetical protein
VPQNREARKASHRASTPRTSNHILTKICSKIFKESQLEKINQGPEKFFNKSPIDPDQVFNYDHDRHENFSIKICRNFFNQDPGRKFFRKVNRKKDSGFLPGKSGKISTR